MNLDRLTPPGLDGATWRVSSYSGGQGECVEVADGIAGIVPVRDSKLAGGPVVRFHPEAWAAFIRNLG